MPPTGTLLTLVTDASGSWGCGAAHTDWWFQLQWPQQWCSISIAPKELVPIIMAAILRGPYWAGKCARCLCDNMAIVATVNKKTAKDPLLAGLPRILALVSALSN